MRRRRALAASGVLLLFLAAVPSASGNEISGATGTTGCSGLNIHDPTDPIINYRRSGLTIANYDQVGWIMVNRISPTDLSISSVSSGGDFVYFDEPYTTFCGRSWWSPSAGGVIGLTNCDALGNSNSCGRHHIYMTTTWTENANTDTSERRKLICHESGHAIGITHNEHTTTAYDSCMRPQATDSSISDYSPHEINDMINYVW